MRYLLLICFLFPAVFADDEGIPASADEKYQGYDIDKKLYQRSWGFFYKRVSIKEIDWERRHQAMLSGKGVSFLFWGGILLAIGLGGSMTFHQPIVEEASSWVSATGGILIGIGMFYMKMTEWWHYLGWVLGIALVIFLVWYLRDKGIIKHVKKTKKENEE